MSANRSAKPKPCPLPLQQGSSDSTPPATTTQKSTPIAAAVPTRVASSSSSSAAGGHQSEGAVPPTPGAHTAAASSSSQPPVRGWDPVADKRFRVALYRQYARDTSSPFTNAVPEDAADGISSPAETASDAPTTDAQCNACGDNEPCVEIHMEAAVTNALSSAYTSSGYPSVVAAGNTRGSVYGSFVDMKNPSLSTLNLPPSEMTVIAPSARHNSAGKRPAMETLMKINWKRESFVTAQSSNIRTASASSTAATAPSLTSPLLTKSTAPPAIANAAPPAAQKLSPALLSHLQQFPDGIHGKNSVPNLSQLILNGILPSEESATPAPAGAPTGSSSSPTAAAAASGATSAASPTTAEKQQQLPSSPASTTTSNYPLPPQPTQGSAPVMHTLVSANTFNHLSVYFVAHQDGKYIYSAPVQTLSASIATRKVTAHQLFMLGKETIETQPSTTASGKKGRTTIPFQTIPISEEDTSAFFDASGPFFVDASATSKTISAAQVNFSVEPMLMFGNQNGDIFVFNIFEEKVVQKFNYGGDIGGQQQLASSKIITSPVSCICEVQNGIEKKMSVMLSNASNAKCANAKTFSMSEAATVPEKGGAEQTYYSMSPSLFAVGFDCGQVLLLCVTVEGGWVLKQFSPHAFGLRPIESIAVRIPKFDVRMWTCYTPPTGNNNSSSYSNIKIAPATPRNALIVAESTLLVAEEHHVAALSCNSGTIVLVRLPGLEPLSLINVYDYNAVGDILSLCWTASNPMALMMPDILLCSGEDDTLTAFRLTSTAPMLTTTSGIFANVPSSAMTDNTTHVSVSSESFAGGASSGLQVLEKKRYHRSWVNHLCVLPLALPSSRTGVGMPQYIGTCLTATSYDSRTSFWPMLFDAMSTDAQSGEGYLLIDGPTAAYPLHSELVIRTAVGGGGTSYFMATVCCRGRVKMWSVKV